MYVICELEVVPLLQQEYEKGYHTLIQAPTGVRRACVVCGTRTRTFCYGCIGAAGTWPHCCSPARDKGRDCFAKLHRLRRPDYQGNERVYAKRRRASDVNDAHRYKRRRERLEDPEKPVRNGLNQPRGCQKGCRLNPHHIS